MEVDPVGDNTYVQFNDNGEFGGAEGLVYNTTLKRVAIGDTLFGSETLYVTIYVPSIAVFTVSPPMTTLAEIFPSILSVADAPSSL